MHGLIHKYSQKYFLICAVYFILTAVFIAYLPSLLALLGSVILVLTFLWVEGKMTKKLIRDIEIEVRIASKV